MSSNVDQFEICEDGHRCENYSKCTRKPNSDNDWMCDCSEADYDEALAGLNCQHAATAYCSDRRGVSSNSFCTNGGTCQATVGPNEAHLDCICEPGFVGEHCQFVDGSMPKDWPYTGASASGVSSASRSGGGGGGGGGNDGLSGGAIAGIVLVCIAAVIGIAFVVQRHVSRKRQAAVPDQFGMVDDDRAGAAYASGGKDVPAELALEADGEVLQEAMSPRKKMAQTIDTAPAEESEVI